MHEHLPALLIALPLLTAPLCVVVRNARLAWALAMGITLFSLVASSLILRQVLESGPISYHLGGWAPPIGIELRIDILNAFVLLIVTGISAIVLIAAPRSLAGWPSSPLRSWWLPISSPIPKGEEPLFMTRKSMWWSAVNTNPRSVIN